MDCDVVPQKKRKPRNDKNKRRKFNNRHYNATSTIINSTSDQLNAPEYNKHLDYYKEYYHMYLQNENLLADIDKQAQENYRDEKRVMCILDFYDCTLIPAMMTQPHKFLHRMEMQRMQN
jgi:hypothetical protein